MLIQVSDASVNERTLSLFGRKMQPVAKVSNNYLSIHDIL